MDDHSRGRQYTSQNHQREDNGQFPKNRFQDTGRDGPLGVGYGRCWDCEHTRNERRNSHSHKNRHQRYRTEANH